MTFKSQAELVLIADEPISQRHLDLASQLCEVSIDQAAFMIEDSRCIWPLQLKLQPHNRIDDIGGHLYYLATHLRKKRETITAIRALGCNLQLTLRFNCLTANFFITSSTMKALGELEIQVDFRLEGE